MQKRLAIYLRLSLEDERTAGMQQKVESNSIGSQRKLIREYIRQDPELSSYETEEYVDDGYSGTNMDRPGIQRLLQEGKDGHLRCIIVKDMSRFSRDYIEMGTCLNRLFPSWGIRFIAINDHYDSREHPGSTIGLDTAFRTLLYDLYSKDISMKVKAAFAQKCAEGEYIFGQVPFGYEKSREVKNAVVVREEEAKVVRRIFALAVEGKSSSQIARQLMEERQPTIVQMRSQAKEPAGIVSDSSRAYCWSGAAVRNILNNRFYLGEMAYGKTLRKPDGSRGRMAVPKEEWKVIPAHHEPIITEEMFEQVKRMALTSHKRGMGG